MFVKCLKVNFHGLAMTCGCNETTKHHLFLNYPIGILVNVVILIAASSGSHISLSLPVVIVASK